jgi:hypothetical protein
MTVSHPRRLRSSAALLQKPHTSQTKIGSGDQPYHAQSKREGLETCPISIIRVAITVTGHNKHGTTSPVIPPTIWCCTEKQNVKCHRAVARSGSLAPHRPLAWLSLINI